MAGTGVVEIRLHNLRPTAAGAGSSTSGHFRSVSRSIVWVAWISAPALSNKSIPSHAATGSRNSGE
jgi:hypothetical protein